MKAFEVIKDEDGSFVCPYCKAKYKGSAGLYQHFRFKHGLSSKDVYDDLCKKDTDGICIICGKETAFKNGRYLITCSPECKAKWFSIDEMRAQKISHNRRKYSTDSFIEKAKELHGDKFEYSQTELSTLRELVSITCKKHGAFETVASNHLLDMCGGCRKCAYESMVHTKSKWTEEEKNQVKELRRRTNSEKYGNVAGPVPFGSDAYKTIIREKLGVENPFCSEEIKEKIKRTNLTKYGFENPAYLEKTKKAGHTKQANKKRYQTHKKNNSFNASKPEDDFYEFLLSVFDKDDVFRNYEDDARYPFACDFYIKSQDLFIELNLYFTHGFHWFNENNPEDQAKKKLWEERTKGKDLYSVAITVWTIQDPIKRETAEKNNLNYVVLWNLEEIDNMK